MINYTMAFTKKRITPVAAAVLLFAVSLGAAPVRAADIPFFTPPVGEAASLIKFSDGKSYVFFCSRPLSGNGPNSLYAVSTHTRKSRFILQSTDLYCTAGSPVTDLADTFVVVAANAVGSSGTEIWKASLAGTGPAESIAGPAAVGTAIRTPEISPDGRWIEYSIVSAQSGYTYRRALSVNIIPSDGSGGSRVLPIVPNDSTWVLAGQFTPDSQTLLYLSDESSGHYIWDLYAVAVDGQTPPRRVTPASCEETAGCWGPITHDSQFIFMNLFAPGGGAAPGIYRVSLHAPTPTWVRVGNTVGHSTLTLSVDEHRLLGQLTDGSNHWNTISIDPSGIEPPALLLHDFPIESQGLIQSHVGCGGSCLAMVVDGPSSVQGSMVYRAPVDGSTPAQLLFSVPPETQGLYAGQVRDSIRRMDVSPDGSRIVVSVPSDDHSELDLYAFPIDGSAPAIRIAHWAGLIDSADAWTPLFGGTQVAVIDEPGYGETPKNFVRVSTSEADGPRTLLSDAAAFGLGAYLWTADGRRILLSGDDGNYYLIDALWSALPVRTWLPTLQR